MKVIACNLNMFEKNHGIYVFDDQTGNSDYVGFSDFDHLPEIICQFCREKDIFEVHLFGAGTYAKLMAEDIVKYNELNYSNNYKEIIVEVN